MRQKLMTIFLTFVLLPTYVFALLAPQIYLTEINLSKENFLPGENIEGEITLWNYENFSFGDLVLHFYLLGEEVEGVPTQVIDSKKDTKVFSLSPGEKKKVSFVYTLPENLPKGALKFRVRLANQKGEEMAWIDKVVNIGGEGEFLVLENYWILKNGEKLAPGGGVDFNPNETPQIIFDAKNKTSFNLAGFIKVTTYKRKEGGEIVSEEKKESVALNSQETKTIKTTLPSLAKPDTYLSKVQILNEKNRAISNPIYFRWVVKGENDAEVLFIQSQKNSFNKGEIAKIKVQFTGPAHEKEIPDKGMLKVKILNEKGEIVGEGEKVVDLKSGEEIVDVYVRKDVENPKIVTEILKEKELLDKYEVEFKKEAPKEVSQEKETPKTSFWKENQTIIIFSGVILIILIGIILWPLLQKRKLILEILFLLALNFILVRFALGAVEVADSPCGTTIYFNSPFPNQEFKVGDLVHFSGGFEVTSCGNGLFFNKIEFFITEDKNIPIKNANCCNNCCGASSKTYTCSSIYNCDQVKILDISNPSFKVYKLGTIYPPDVHAGARPYEVQFDRYFTIPADLGFSGNVRFYVQYSGTHWKSHWHWNITYQPGRINSPPEARNLKVIQPDCCLTVYPKAIFKWEFFDPDFGEGQSAFRIQVDDNEDFSSPEIDTGKIMDMANEYHLPSFLSFNKKYWWRIKVWDTKGSESSWTKSSTYFETPKHSYPQVDFSWFPTNPSLNEEASFFDKTKFAEGVLPKSWFWQFQNGVPSTSNEQNPKVRFQKRGENQVTLRVTDSDNLTCQKTKVVFVPYPLPKWQEALPSASIFNIFKNIFKYLIKS
jgi:hypothetical protein